jgi:hypothetical protein
MWCALRLRQDEIEQIISACSVQSRKRVNSLQSLGSLNRQRRVCAGDYRVPKFLEAGQWIHSWHPEFGRRCPIQLNELC